MLARMHAPTQSGPDLEYSGIGTAGITPDDQLAVSVQGQTIVIALTPAQMRKLAMALHMSAMRLEMKQGGG